MPLPVILEQNHIAAGDKMLFPVGKSRKCKHFRAGGSMPRPYWGKLFEIFKLEFIEQSVVVRSWSGDLQGVSKGGSNGAVRCLKKLVCFPFWPSGESEDRTEGPQLLLCILSCQHKKVWPPAGDQLSAARSLNYEAAIYSIAPMLTLSIIFV